MAELKKMYKKNIN